MQLHHLALRVSNFQASLHFYQTLCHLEVFETFQPEGGNIAYLKDPKGGSMLELIALPQGESVQASGLFLCFGTDQLDQAHALAVKEGFHPSEIRNPEPNARYFYVYDPDGISVQLREYQ